MWIVDRVWKQKPQGDVWIVHDELGRRGYFKIPGRNKYYGGTMIANELIAASLARILGFPVAELELAQLCGPDGEVRHGIISLQRPAHQLITWSDASPQIKREPHKYLLHMQKLREMVVFDAWILNTDRGSGKNLILYRGHNEDKWDWYLIDHGNTLYGSPYRWRWKGWESSHWDSLWKYHLVPQGLLKEQSRSEPLRSMIHVIQFLQSAPCMRSFVEYLKNISPHMRETCFYRFSCGVRKSCIQLFPDGYGTAVGRSIVSELFRKEVIDMPIKRQHVPSKLLKTAVLVTNNELKRLVPETRSLTIVNLKEMLEEYTMVYVKPNVGSYGRGVMRVELLGPNKSVVCLHIGRSARECSSFEELLIKIKKITGARPYLVQHGIRMLTHQGRLFDIRVMVQYSPEGIWETTGYLARVAALGRVVTNYHSGGTPQDLGPILSQYLSHADTAAFMKRLCRLGEQVAVHLHKSFPRLREIGLDIAVDADLIPWILEVNTNPHADVFMIIGDKTMYHKIRRYAKHYGKKLPRLARR